MVKEAEIQSQIKVQYWVGLGGRMKAGGAESQGIQGAGEAQR